MGNPELNQQMGAKARALREDVESATKGYRADLETLMANEYAAWPHSNAPGLDEKLTDIIELLALIADGSAHRGANEARICEIKDKYGL